MIDYITHTDIICLVLSQVLSRIVFKEVKRILTVFISDCFVFLILVSFSIFLCLSVWCVDGDLPRRAT